MSTAATPIVERIARVLAGWRLSDNAEGVEASAGPSVDLEWEDHVADALAVLRTMRVPDAAMAEAGDAGIWEVMIDRALASHASADKGNPLAPPINTGAGS